MNYHWRAIKCDRQKLILYRSTGSSLHVSECRLTIDAMKFFQSQLCCWLSSSLAAYRSKLVWNAIVAFADTNTLEIVTNAIDQLNRHNRINWGGHPRRPNIYIWQPITAAQITMSLYQCTRMPFSIPIRFALLPLRWQEIYYYKMLLLVLSLFIAESRLVFRKYGMAKYEKKQCVLYWLSSLSSRVHAKTEN